MSRWFARAACTAVLYTFEWAMSCAVCPRFTVRRNTHRRIEGPRVRHGSSGFQQYSLVSSFLLRLSIRFYDFRLSRASGPKPIDSACSKTPIPMLVPRARSLGQPSGAPQQPASAAVEAIASTAAERLLPACSSGPLYAHFKPNPALSAPQTPSRQCWWVKTMQGYACIVRTG